MFASAIMCAVCVPMFHAAWCDPAVGGPWLWLVQSFDSRVDIRPPHYRSIEIQIQSSTLQRYSVPVDTQPGHTGNIEISRSLSMLYLLTD